MLESLLPYYERELGHLRELSGEFARRYPKIAGRLQLEGDQCEDPHTERLIEAFAFLTALHTAAGLWLYYAWQHGLDWRLPLLQIFEWQ